MSGRAWYKDCWQVPGIKRADQFFSALPDLLTLPVYLRFEATGMAADIRALLQSHSVDPALKISRGTLWPKPSVFHVMTSEDFIRDIVGLAGSVPESSLQKFCERLGVSFHR